jgi:mannose-6-phosphate isomerase-like protein (cupin superfamily)
MVKAHLHTNIEMDTLDNVAYRKVIYTGLMQLVLMSLNPGEEIGTEIHDGHDQFFRIEQGQATAVLNGNTIELKEDEVLIVPAGTKHNLINTGDTGLKLYTIYAPSEHPENTLQITKPIHDQA